jgi:hypothetical protein
MIPAKRVVAFGFAIGLGKTPVISGSLAVLENQFLVELA